MQKGSQQEALEAFRSGRRQLTVYAGIDVGSLSTPSYVAWCEDDILTFDLYIPTRERPLPRKPGVVLEAVGLDAPQGLPQPFRRRRVADQEAKTPTSVMPATRAELNEWKLYGALVRAGVEIFWWAYQAHHLHVLGLPKAEGTTTVVCETYPRYVLQRLAPKEPTPSKRKQPLQYIDLVWPLIQAQGYRSPSIVRPTVDQVDAALCAVAARECLHTNATPAGMVGAPPVVDEGEQVLREGYIVAP